MLYTYCTKVYHRLIRLLVPSFKVLFMNHRILKGEYVKTVYVIIPGKIRVYPQRTLSQKPIFKIRSKQPPMKGRSPDLSIGKRSTRISYGPINHRVELKSVVGKYGPILHRGERDINCLYSPHHI
jgi:hypothetical protein